MAKSVLISIRPEWVEKIVSGEKTVEIRKSRPNLETPFKCYIYCTKPKYEHEDFIRTDYPKPQFYGGGKVIGEFMCTGFIPFCNAIPCFVTTPPEKVFRAACMTKKELRAYAPEGNPIGWRISNLKIYDTPKDLIEFRAPCGTQNCDSLLWEDTVECAGCLTSKDRKLRRPPQSWRYVEDSDNG